VKGGGIQVIGFRFACRLSVKERLIEIIYVYQLKKIEVFVIFPEAKDGLVKSQFVNHSTVRKIIKYQPWPKWPEKEKLPEAYFWVGMCGFFR